MGAPRRPGWSRLVVLWLAVPAAAFAAHPRPTLDTESIERSPADKPGVPTVLVGDTVWIADWSFDAPNGSCTDAGWTRYDNRILNDGSNYWSIDARFAGTGSIVGNAAVLSKHDLAWARDGYGNYWDYSIILAYRGATTLAFAYLSDSEPGYDFVSVEADSAGASEARVDYSIDPTATPSAFRRVLLRVDGPRNAVVGPLALPDFAVPATQHEVYIRFASDDQYSDEDGLYPTSLHAGLVVDQIAVAGALAYSENFEGTLNPNVTLVNTAPSTPFGEWARVYPHVTDNDACTENPTCAWLWSDPNLPAHSPAMAFGPGGAVVRNWLDDAIVSPWVNLGPALGPNYTILYFRRFAGNAYNTSRIVQAWNVRSMVRIDNTDTSTPGDSLDVVRPWRQGNWNSLSTFKWETRTADITGYVDTGARAIQIRFRVSDWQYISGIGPPSPLDPGPGPYIDRVRIGRRTPTGPVVGTLLASFYAAVDGFPSRRVFNEDFTPSTDRFGTVDFAQSTIDIYSPGPAPYTYNTRDSIVVDVTDVRGAGITGVGVYAAIVAGPHQGKAPPPWSIGANGLFYVPATYIRNQYWFVDLDDEYFRGGDLLVYCWVATDGAGGFTSLPGGLTGVPASIQDAQTATGGLFEVSSLPTIDWDPSYLARIAAHPSGKIDPTPAEIAGSRQRSCILYEWSRLTYDLARRSGPAHRSSFMHTLDVLGYKNLYDVYFHAWNVYTVHLAGRASVQQATGYPLIIQDSGPNSYLTIPPGGRREGAINQVQWYRDWLAQGATSEAGWANLWILGDAVVGEAVSDNNPLVLIDMGVSLVSTTQSLYPYPNVEGQRAFVWADGDSTDFRNDLAGIRHSNCSYHSNNGLGATGTAQVTHRYTLGSVVGDGAAVMNANAAHHWNTIMMSFSWEDLLDPRGAAPEARREAIAANILGGILTGCGPGISTDAPPPDVAMPRATALYANVPNPFNPVTTIRFDLALAAPVRLQVFDVAGRLVRTLLDERREAGWDHRVTWSGQDESGRQVANGIYFYRLTAGAFTGTRKLVVLR